MKTSCAFLTLLAVALMGASRLRAETSEQQRLDADRSRCRADSSPKPGRPQDRARHRRGRPFLPPPGAARRADARRRRRARARAQPRPRGRAAQPADLRLLARRARCHLPPELHLHLRPAQPDVVHAQPDGRRRHPQHRHADRQQRRHAEHQVGRRQLRGRVQQQPPGAVGPVCHAQPGAQLAT